MKVLLLVISAQLFVSCLSKAATQIDAEQIMRHADKIVSFGPHPPGTEAQKEVGDYLITQMQSYGLRVETQEFEAVTPIGRLAMRNIWGILPGTRNGTIILASHYDSKYFEEFTFVGANDGASSSAVVLELARVTAQTKPVDYTLWFVFFDGEESIREWTDLDSLYGSREFVRMLDSQARLDEIQALILLDLIGGKDVVFRQDLQSTRWLVELIWRTAEKLGYGSRFGSGYTNAIDDHIPFAEKGVDVVDIIDLNYPYWHTPDDTLDKLSPENMKMVAEVVLAALPEVAKSLGSERRRNRFRPE